MIETTLAYIIGLIASYGLPVLLLLFFLKGIIIAKPISSTLILTVYIASYRPDTIIGAIMIGLLCTFIFVIGESIIYYIVKERGIEGLKRIPKVEQIVTEKEETDGRIKQLYEKYNGFSILIGSAIPGVRTFILIPAAVSEYPMYRAIPLSFIGSGIYYTGIVLVVAGVVQAL